MTRLEEFCKRMEDDKVIQISGGVFIDHTRPNGQKIKANITPENYCISMGNIYSTSAEEYADELLDFLDAPTQEIVGECPYCYAFLIEGDPHDNCKDVRYKIPVKKCSECGCDGKANEIINYEEAYLCNECANNRGELEL